jgi:hypothetical protein
MLEKKRKMKGGVSHHSRSTREAYRGSITITGKAVLVTVRIPYSFLASIPQQKSYRIVRFYLMKDEFIFQEVFLMVFIISVTCIASIPIPS